MNAPLDAGLFNSNFAYGEWPLVGQDELNSNSHDNETQINIKNASTLVQAWNFTNQGRDVSVLSQPMVSDGAVFAADTGGHVYSLEASTGTLLWKTKIPSQVFKSAPTLNAQYVFIGSNTFYCLDKKTGAIVWSTQLYESGHPQSVTTSHAIIIDNLLVFGIAPGQSSGASNVVALDIATGNTLWKLAVPDDATGQMSWSSPAVDNARKLVYFGTYNPVNTKADALLAIDYSKGTLAWTTKLTAELLPLRPTLLSHPVGGHPNLFTVNATDYLGIGCRDGHYRIYKRDQSTTQNIQPAVDFKLDPGSSYGPIASISNGVIYIVSSAYVDPDQNRRSIDAMYTIIQLQYAKNIFNNATMKVTAIDLEKLIKAGKADGILPKTAVLWVNNCKGVSFNNRLTVANGVLYETSWTGFLRCLNIANGSELWKKVVSPVVKNTDYPFPAFIGGGATVVDGQVYVGYGVIDFGQDTTKGGITAYKLYNYDDQPDPLDYINASMDL